MPSISRQFINMSIKWRFPKDQIVTVINSKDCKFCGSEYVVVGWTATRVVLKILRTNQIITRVPRNITKPTPFAYL